ncbi:MAG: alpha/beta hydrolase [Gammaproteobacteria bacterium]|nr:alpha/beta hydrolase [Gammaproteobacteria bacterium]
MFEGFTQQKIDVGDAQINLRLGGAGPALLLLHGFPQTHVHWHAVAPLLATHFSLVIPDLRGYGESTGPAADPEHRNYSKRVMAQDMVVLMNEIGHERFLLAGHDRGARVAYRLALDHPGRVVRLASLDTVPTLDIWERMDMDAALGAFHWPFLAQPAPLPERLIGNDPDFFLAHLLSRWAGSPGVLDEAAVAHYAEHFRKPSVLEAMAEDYRAGATVDLLHDREDRVAGRKITCPVFVPWGKRYTRSSPLRIWQAWAGDVSELCLDCGHFIAEEEPQACAAALQEFFSR